MLIKGTAGAGGQDGKWNAEIGLSLPYDAMRSIPTMAIEDNFQCRGRPLLLHIFVTARSPAYKLT